MEPTAEQTWFIRSRGRVLGPFTLPQLEMMSKRGQFTRFHEVSIDRRNWDGSAAVVDRFASARGLTLPTADRGEGEGLELMPSASDAPGWYFARDDRQQGPVPFQELQRMAAQGEINGRTLVWNDGMLEWAPAEQVGGLFPLAGPGSGAAAHSPAGGVDGLTAIPRTSGLAIASLVLGILWLCGVGSLLATIFGGVALGQIGRSGGRLEGKGMAVAGLVLGILGLSWWALIFLGVLVRPPIPMR